MGDTTLSTAKTPITSLEGIRGGKPAILHRSPECSVIAHSITLVQGKTISKTLIMTNQEIINKAMEKARGNGWMPPVFPMDHVLMEMGRQSGKSTLSKALVHYVIFSHDFAKALWGEELIALKMENGELLLTEKERRVASEAACVYHLQEMVIADDPIQYLGQHLDD